MTSRPSEPGDRKRKPKAATMAWAIVDKNRRVVFDQCGDAYVSTDKEDMRIGVDKSLGESLAKVKILVKKLEDK